MTELKRFFNDTPSQKAVTAFFDYYNKTYSNILPIKSFLELPKSFQIGVLEEFAKRLLDLNEVIPQKRFAFDLLETVFDSINAKAE